MPTIKKRTNLTLSDDLNAILEMLAKRDSVSKSAKAVQLMELAISIEEDEVFAMLAEKRMQKNAKFISHEDLWG